MNVCGGFGDADVRISWLGHLGRWWGGGGGGGQGVTHTDQAQERSPDSQLVS